MRTFLACAIDEQEAVQLYAALEPLRAVYQGGAFRWVPPSNYHLTVRFFGELPSAAVAAIDGLISPITDVTGPIRCVAAAPQPLPRNRSPSVIALPIASGARVEQLAALCNASLVGEFGPADKPFKAHVTVARCRRGARFLESPNDFAFPLALTRLVLFESSSSKAGPRYAPLREYRLRG